jgi:hypothetical protein
MDTTNPVRLSKDAKYPLMEPKIPPGVIMEKYRLGLISNLKYAYHDIMDEKKFSELAKSTYLKRYISTETHMIMIDIQTWEIGMEKVDIQDLFEIPHFGRSIEINAYMKIFLSCMHRGYLCLNRSVSLDTDLIV